MAIAIITMVVVTAMIMGGDNVIDGCTDVDDDGRTL